MRSTINTHTMNIKTVFTLLVAVALTQSCKIEITGYTGGYDKISNEDKKLIRFGVQDICNLPNDQSIIPINGLQLKDCLAQTDSALVYSWVPHCSGKNCVPLNVCQAYAERHNLTLYVVAQEYDMDMMKAQNHGEKPLFMIDHKYYDANKRSTYTKKFNKDLLGDAAKDKDLRYALFKVFHKDQYVRTITSVLEPQPE